MSNDKFLGKIQAIISSHIHRNMHKVDISEDEMACELLNLFQGEIMANRPTGQLTPEEVLEIVFDLYNDCAIEVIDIKHRDEKAVAAIVEYAAQECEALRQELKKRTDYADGKSKESAALLEKLSAYEGGGYTWIRTPELAALREELEKQKEQMYSADEMAEKDARIKELEEQVQAEVAKKERLKTTYTDLYKELEAVKKERDTLKNRIEDYTEVFLRVVAERDGLKERLLFNKDQTSNLLQAYARRDEAVNLLRETINTLSDDISRAGVCIMDIADFLSRLSSGETKPDRRCPQCCPGEMQPVMDGLGNKTWKCLECGAETLPKINPSNNSSSEHGIPTPLEWEDICEKAADAIPSPWISVEDRLPEKRKQKVDYYHLGEYKQGYFVRKFKMNTGFLSYRFSDSAKEIDPTKMHPASHWTPLPAPPESLTDKK